MVYLPLFDYVCRAHQIEIGPLSVRRPSAAPIISKSNSRISFKFQLLVAVGYTPGCFVFEVLKKKKKKKKKKK